MKAALVVAAALVLTSGCANSPRQPDVQCVNAGKYAFTMAMLREAGIPLKSLAEYTTRSSVVTFPVNTIQAFVMGSKASPAENRELVLTLCNATGWNRLEGELKSRFSYIPDAIVEPPVNTAAKTLSNTPHPGPMIGPSFRIAPDSLR